MSDFMRTLCKIAIPVTLQGMLQASFSIVDQIMIGQLGEAGIAAVGLCGNFTLIFSVMSGAVGTVAGILIAQFLGAEEHTEAQRRQHRDHSGHRLSGNMVRRHPPVSAGCLWAAVGHRGCICPAQRRGSIPAGLVPCDVPQAQLDGQPVRETERGLKNAKKPPRLSFQEGCRGGFLSGLIYTTWQILHPCT